VATRFDMKLRPKNLFISCKKSCFENISLLNVALFKDTIKTFFKFDYVATTVKRLLSQIWLALPLGHLFATTISYSVKGGQVTKSIIVVTITF